VYSFTLTCYTCFFVVWFFTLKQQPLIYTHWAFLHTYWSFLVVNYTVLQQLYASWGISHDFLCFFVPAWNFHFLIVLTLCCEKFKQTFRRFVFFLQFYEIVLYIYMKIYIERNILLKHFPHPSFQCFDFCFFLVCFLFIYVYTFSFAVFLKSKFILFRWPTST
jgi:hypothetical protein